MERSSARVLGSLTQRFTIQIPVHACSKALMAMTLPIHGIGLLACLVVYYVMAYWFFGAVSLGRAEAWKRIYFTVAPAACRSA